MPNFNTSPATVGSDVITVTVSIPGGDSVNDIVTIYIEDGSGRTVDATFIETIEGSNKYEAEITLLSPETGLSARVRSKNKLGAESVPFVVLHQDDPVAPTIDGFYILVEGTPENHISGDTITSRDIVVTLDLVTKPGDLVEIYDGSLLFLGYAQKNGPVYEFPLHVDEVNYPTTIEIFALVNRGGVRSNGSNSIIVNYAPTSVTYVKDTFTGSGTLDTHVGETGANWGNTGVALIDSDTNVISSLPQYALTVDGLEAESGGTAGTVWSSGSVGAPEAFCEMEITANTTASGYFHVEFGMINPTGSLTSPNEGLYLYCMMDVYKDDLVYGSLEANQFIDDPVDGPGTRIASGAIDLDFDYTITAPTFDATHVYRVEARTSGVKLLIDGVEVASLTPSYGTYDTTGAHFFFYAKPEVGVGDPALQHIHRVEVGSL